MRAAPTGRRAVLLVVAFVALAAVLATAHSHTRAATARSQELPGLWALEVTPEFAPLVRARLLALAKKRGLNTLVLNRHLSDRQKRRVRSVARRFGLRAVQLRRRVCEREVTLCAVVTRTAAAAERLSRSRHVDIVVLRLRGPKPVPRLTEKYVRAASGTASARLLLLPTLRPRFARASWRRATSTVAGVPFVDLGVRPSGRSSRRAVGLFLGVLPPRPGAVIFRGDFETGNHLAVDVGCAVREHRRSLDWVLGARDDQRAIRGRRAGKLRGALRPPRGSKRLHRLRNPRQAPDRSRKRRLLRADGALPERLARTLTRRLGPLARTAQLREDLGRLR